MKRSRRFALLVLVLGTTVVSAAPPAQSVLSPADYLDKAIEIVRDNALYSSRVDWDKVRAEAHRRAQGATSAVATYPTIRYVLHQLGDHHSFLQLDKAHRAAERKALGGRHEDTPSAFKPARKLSKTYLRRKPEFRTLTISSHHKLGYLVMPDTKPGRRDDAFSTKYQNGLRTLQKASPCGWIVDLRGNDGGNVFPMLAGLGPLLGNGMVAGAVDNHGGMGSFVYRDGKASYRDAKGKQMVTGEVRNPLPPIRPAPPVAVLVDSLTASSGEIMAIAFQGRVAATRTFGEHTYGASTATVGHRLPDGANLVIAEGVDVDRQHRRYSDGIQPDVVIPDADTRPVLDDDAAVLAAKAWLATQPVCRGRT